MLFMVIQELFGLEFIGWMTAAGPKILELMVI